MKKNKKIILLVIILSLVNCAANNKNSRKNHSFKNIQEELDSAIHSNTNSNDNKHLDIPNDVKNELFFENRQQFINKQPTTEKRIDISAKNVSAQTFFMSLSQSSPSNMIVSPKIEGNITLNLKQVTLEEALQNIESVYGYVYKKTNSGYEILPNNVLESRVFMVNYINAARSGSSNTLINSGEITSTSGASGTSGTSTNNTSNSTGGSSTAGKNSSGSSVTTTYNVNFWEELGKNLQKLIPEAEGRELSVNSQAGVILVKAFPSELKKLENYLDTIEKRMGRQVIIEAKILEVTLDNNYQAGINWEKIKFGSWGNPGFNGTNNNTTEGMTKARFDSVPENFTFNVIPNGSFSATIQAIEEQGTIQILSSPRISTMNNQKAVIKVGSNEFFVTNISSSNTTGTTGGTGAAAVAQDIELTPFFSGISLDVIPQIDHNDNVTLHIHPIISSVNSDNKTIRIDDRSTTLPLAKSTVRESDTIVHAKNNQVIVIGGLMQDRKDEDISQVPLMGHIPFLGSAFRNTHQKSRKIELVILLKPKIVNSNVVRDDLEETKSRFNKNYEGFHIGGRPDLYGYDGEFINVSKNKHNEQKYYK